MGQAPPAANCNKDGGGTPFVKVGEFGALRPEIREWTTDPKRLAEETDVLICVVGATCGKINLGIDCAIGRSVAAIRPIPDKLDQRFLWYLMQGRVEQMRSGSQGSAQTVITKKMINNLEVAIPPLEEQRRIVALLDEAFAGIDTAIANTKKNLANARELFESVVHSTLNAGKEGWHRYSLAEACTIESKLVDPREPEFQNLPHVGAGNMVSKTGEIVDVMTAKEEGLKSGKFYFDQSVVLYSKIRPNLMKACRPDFEGLCSADVYPLIPNTEVVTRDMLFHILMGPDFTEYAISGSARAGMPKVNRGHVFAYELPLPDVNEQRRLTEVIDAIACQCEVIQNSCSQKLVTLQNLKQSMLQRVFAGELTTRQNQVEQVSTKVLTTTPEFTAQIIALAQYSHNQKQRPTFGRVKAAKTLHLAESIAGIDLDRKPEKWAAGPHDEAHLKACENWAETNKFFRFRKRDTGGYDFITLSNYQDLLATAKKALQPYSAKLEKIITILASMKSKEAEVFATVHAAWNNLIVDDVEISDDAIVREARDDWHTDKFDIEESKFRDAILLIRQKGVEPDGTAKYVGGQGKLF